MEGRVEEGWREEWRRDGGKSGGGMEGRVKEGWREEWRSDGGEMKKYEKKNERRDGWIKGWMGGRRDEWVEGMSRSGMD